MGRRPRWVAPVGDAERAAVRAVSPLAAGLLLRCEPFDVPVAVAALPGGAEHRAGEAGDLLRATLRADPWAGPGSLAPDGWLLVASDDAALVFAQRRGSVGLGRVLALERRDGAWRAARTGGCGLVLPDRRERAEHLFGVRPVEGSGRSRIDLDWDCGADLAGRPQRRVRRVEVLLAPEAVHVLLVSEAEPALPPPRPSPRGRWVVAGTGRTAVHRLDLGEPLAGRPVLDDAHLPAQRLVR